MQRQGAPNDNCIFTVFIFDVCWSKTSFSEKKKSKFSLLLLRSRVFSLAVTKFCLHIQSTIWIRSAWKKKAQPLPSKKANSWFMAVQFIWDTTKSSPRISNPITIFLGMQRDHGKPFASVTIFWFLENLKLKDISVYYYLQRTSMSIKMSEEGEFKSWMCVH